MKQMTREKMADIGNAILIELIAAVLKAECEFSKLHRAGYPPLTRQQMLNRVAKLIESAEGT